MGKIKLLLGASILLLLFGQVNAAIIFDQRSPFESLVQNIIVDDYQHPDYEHGDIVDGLNDLFTNERMSEIFGETTYRSTGFNAATGDVNWIARYTSTSPDRFYCAGCNGSFELTFLDTSISSLTGVGGVGIDIVGNYSFFPYSAYVTYGDNSTQNFSLPLVGGAGAPGAGKPVSFWGIASDLGIKSIHFGGLDGMTTTNGSFSIDNLTIGSYCSEFPGGGNTGGCFPGPGPFPGKVPEPPAIFLFGIGLLGLIGLSKRRKAA